MLVDIDIILGVFIQILHTKSKSINKGKITTPVSPHVNLVESSPFSSLSFLVKSVEAQIQLSSDF